MAYTALSFVCLKNFNVKINLYTDNKGKELLDFLPYDNVFTVLDDLKMDPYFFAAGKMIAFQLCEDGDVCIDSDLFIMMEIL
ncbi:MAG: hypothetical protein LBD03_03505 [Methanobrevibacter sp.]|jgi:hypothetical protein|nr:hypothetical protein [Candidatus Methanovirga procula]